MIKHFTLVIVEYRSGEPQTIVSCDLCRTNMCFSPYVSWFDQIRFAKEHRCPSKINILSFNVVAAEEEKKS